MGNRGCRPSPVVHSPAGVEDNIKPSHTDCVHTVRQRMPPSFLQTPTASVFSLCRLRTESRQSPIRIKRCRDALRAPWRPAPPRETLVPSRVQGVASVDGCRDGDASPLLAHSLGDSVICIPSGGAKTASNQWLGLCTRPLLWLTVFGHSVTRNIGSHRKASARAACGSRRAPVCAPAPWSPQWCSSCASCARRIALLAGSSEGRSWPPRRRPRRGTCCRSWRCLLPFFLPLLSRRLSTQRQ